MCIYRRLAIIIMNDKLLETAHILTDVNNRKVIKVFDEIIYFYGSICYAHYAIDIKTLFVRNEFIRYGWIKGFKEAIKDTILGFIDDDEKVNSVFSGHSILNHKGITVILID